jgi:hypothetical protein
VPFPTRAQTRPDGLKGDALAIQPPSGYRFFTTLPYRFEPCDHIEPAVKTVEETRGLPPQV